jgi:hypothetical protein
MRKWSGANPYTPSNFTTYIQLGELGSTANAYVTPAGYGLYVRSTSDDSRFLLADDNGLQIRGAAFKMYNSTLQTVDISATDGSVKLGTDVSSGATTSFDFNGATGDLSITGDLYTGKVYLLQASGLNTEQDVWGSWDNRRALQWWPDLTSMTGDPSLSMYTGKHSGGSFPDQNFSYIDANPTGGQLAGLWITAFGQGTGADAIIYLEGGSQSLASTPSVSIAASAIDLVAAVAVTGSLSVGGTAVSLDGHTHSYLPLSGGALSGTLTAQNITFATDNTYDIGAADKRVQDLYAVNLHVNSIVGTPSYSHEHAASDITSGTMAEARLPHAYTSAFTLDADSAGTSNYLRWLTQTATGKAWDLVARAHDYATTASQQNDLLLTFYDGSTVNLVWQADSATRVVDFTQTPTVGGTTVSLSTHNHDSAYVPLARTVTAGSGLTGGGALSANITLGHADTSSVGDVANTNGTVLQSVTFDTYGHVQTVASYNLDNRYYTESEITTLLASYVPTSRTVTAGAGMTGGGALSADITISHLDTSSQTTVTNTGTSFIQSVTLDTYGHVTALASADIGAALDSRYVNVTGDTMSGALTAGAGVLISSGAVGTPSLAASGDTDTGIYWPAANTLAFSMGGTQRLQLSSTGGTLTGILSITTATVTPSITTGSGNLALSSTGGTVAVTGALTGSSTATFATSVAVPLVTASSGDLTLNSAAGSVAINAATGQAVNLQVAGATQWAANETRLLPRSTVTVDIGDYNRRVRTLHAAELAVETLVAQNVMATIGGRITVAPTVKLIADLANTGTATTFNTALTSWWTLNEASGTRSDSRGSNNLTDTNTVTSTTGKQGNAANFTGSSSEKLNRSDNSSLSAGDVDFLFCAWIYPTLNNAARQTIINKGSTTTGEYRLEIDWTTSKVYWSVWNSSNVQTEVASFGTITTNTWYFVCAWHDAAGNVIGVSVNGVEATAAHSTGVRDSTGNFCLGARDTDRYYTGYIDEVGYWDAYLPSAHERRWLYNKGAGRVYADVNTQVSSTMDVDSNSLTSGDFIYMAAAPGGIAQIEAMRVASSATTITGGYRYTVVRNHDGTGLNSWNTGDAVITSAAPLGPATLT